MSNQPGAAKPGFYPAENGRMRFWDGDRWTDRYADLETPPPPPPQGATQAEPKKRSWFARHKILTGLGVLILLGIVISLANGGKSSAPTASTSAASSSAPSTSTSSTAPAAAATSAPSASSSAPAPAAPAAPAETVSQQNAVKKAASYLQYSAFSRSGLIKQLSQFEGFSTADATYGVDKQNADWNEQAAKKAKDYLSNMSFSRSALIKQLVDFEGFTNEQAQYGVQKTGL